jgi:exo-1,4-beta-D-glucosaminidase
VDLAADGSQRVLDIPANIFQPEQSTHFVRLEMRDAAGKVVSRNFYWVPSKLTVFDWSKTEYTYTPAISYPNMQALRTLPKSQIRGTLTTTNHVLHVRLENPSHALAFQVEVRGFTDDGKPILPLLWSDDFVELMPGEHRDLTAELPKTTAANQASIIVSGWNTNTLKLGANLAANAGTGAE